MNAIEKARTNFQDAFAQVGAVHQLYQDLYLTLDHNDDPTTCIKEMMPKLELLIKNLINARKALKRSQNATSNKT
jgi:hypothetical protein